MLQHMYEMSMSICLSKQDYPRIRLHFYNTTHFELSFESKQIDSFPPFAANEAFYWPSLNQI